MKAKASVRSSRSTNKVRSLRAIHKRKAKKGSLVRKSAMPKAMRRSGGMYILPVGGLIDGTTGF